MHGQQNIKKNRRQLICKR